MSCWELAPWRYGTGNLSRRCAAELLTKLHQRNHENLSALGAGPIARVRREPTPQAQIRQGDVHGFRQATGIGVFELKSIAPSRYEKQHS